MDDDVDLRALADIEQIKALKARYFRLMDTKQWSAWRQLFTDDLDAAFDHTSSGPTVRLGNSGDAVVEAVRARLDPAISVHHGHTPEIELTGPSTARGIWAMSDVVEFPAEPRRSVVGTGHYHEEYRKGDDGRWRISRFHLTRLRVDPLESAPRQVRAQ